MIPKSREEQTRDGFDSKKAEEEILDAMISTDGKGMTHIDISDEKKVQKKRR